MKQKNKRILNVGTTSLILIFTVLALVTFALLALSGASAQMRLAQKMADRTTEYYHADNKARQTLYQVQQLAEAVLAETDSEKFAEKLQAEVEKDPGLQWKDGKVCWTNEITEGQQIEAEAEVTTASDGGSVQVKVTRWKLTETAIWQKDDSLQVLS